MSDAKKNIDSYSYSNFLKVQKEINIWEKKNQKTR